jgi:NTP pyrophosphatase (non-canonical NTP hydrolase)
VYPQTPEVCVSAAEHPSVVGLYVRIGSMNFSKLQEDSAQLEDFILRKARGSKDDIFVLITHLLAECGEAADDIKGMEGKRAEPPSNYSKEELAKELIDIVFNTLRIANHYDIDLDNYWDDRIEGIKQKFK